MISKKLIEKINLYYSRYDLDNLSTSDKILLIINNLENQINLLTIKNLEKQGE